MTKEIFFDLEFTAAGVNSLTDDGECFLVCAGQMEDGELYYNAIQQGLHVKFSSADVRDKLARI